MTETSTATGAVPSASAQPSAVATRQLSDVQACADPRLRTFAGTSATIGRTTLLFDLASDCDLLHLTLEVDLTPLPGNTEDCYDAPTSTRATEWIPLECLRSDGRAGIRGYRFEATRTRAGQNESRLTFNYPDTPSRFTPGMISLTWSWNRGLSTTRDFDSLTPVGPPSGVGKNYRSLPLPTKQ